ncbi:hypothetical protein LOTGIDRAFT_231774 [Lottia gigantea]|uniref:KY-like immunoglobulin-like domain-containing protein n=1 Tax=Lottia gigantea TaxID=225164 RepID=V3ZZQ1_LOTGI|nr:hypothetical protein LOTGIDRAFT_231774 [Lottia gigantea]ESO97033.1 hypothetical protein LOTGIDRAFT_231774 [Lottia gigantea]
MSGKPELPYGYLGAQPKFSEFGMTTLSHNNPEVAVSDNQIEVKFKTTRPVKLTGNLVECANEQEHKDYVFCHTQNDVSSMIATMPNPGYYKLQIYALPCDDDSKTLPGVFNYLINNQGSAKAPTPFPKQYAPWKDGCYLYDPIVLNRSMNLSNIQVKLHVPNAAAVAATVEGDWTHLERDAQGLWAGQLNLDKFKQTGCKVCLNANYGGDKTKFATLLEYSL